MMPSAVDLPHQPWTLTPMGSESQRDPLIRFWLAAPIDQLQALWASPVGDATRQLIRQLTPTSPFTPEQLRTRDALNLRLQQQGIAAPDSIQLLLAVLLLSPPGLLRIANPSGSLPAWLLPAYQALYEQQAAAPVVAQPQAAPAAPPAGPDFGPFPATLAELATSRIQLNRMLGLANLYYIDPEDQEILQELQQLRRDLAAAIQCAPEAELETFWTGDIGERYWAVVRSGIQKEPLSPADQQLKQQVTLKLQPAQGGGFGTPGAINAFLVAMLLFEPGTMTVDGADHKLPAWLLAGYQDTFAKPLQAQA